MVAINVTFQCGDCGAFSTPEQQANSPHVCPKTGPTCDNCGDGVRPNGDERFEKRRLAGGGGQKDSEIDAVLRISMKGGYFEFIDTAFADPTERDFLFCESCAKRLWDAFPVFEDRLGRLINAHVGHNHGGNLQWKPLFECGECWPRP